MIESPLKLGFVGGASNSAVGYAHFIASQMDMLWKIEAGTFSRNWERNLETGRQYKVETNRVYKCIDDLLEKEVERLDAVVILVPTPLHTEMVLKCLDAGMPVICEKALSMTSSEVMEIHEKSKSLGGFLAVIYNYSGYPMIRELRRLINEGALGDLLYIQAEMPQEGFLRTDDKGQALSIQGWRQQDNSVPTIHLDLAVHLHELVYYLTGLQPDKVISDQSSFGMLEVIDNVSCLCRYKNNVKGQFWFSKSSLGHRNGLKIRINGSQASAEWCQLNPEEVLISYANGQRHILDRATPLCKIADKKRYNRFKAGHPAGFNEALANIYMDIHTALSNFYQTGVQESDEIFGSSLALDGMLWLEAMVRSCKTEQWEGIESIDDSSQ